VNSLYAAYQGAPVGFASKYLKIWRPAVRFVTRKLLAPFGLEAADRASGSRSQMIEGLIDQLE